MPNIHLTAETVRKAKCLKGQTSTVYYDTYIPGFLLECRPSKARTYYLRTRDKEGRLHQSEIGKASQISIKDAREMAEILSSILAIVHRD